MAKLVFELNQSLDGYIDHQELGPPRPVLFRHFIEEPGAFEPFHVGSGGLNIGAISEVAGFVLVNAYFPFGNTVVMRPFTIGLRSSGPPQVSGSATQVPGFMRV
jgi:hypothetical protein